MTVEQPGSFLLSLEDGSGQNVAMPTGLIVPYSPEYRIETGDAERELQRLADMTGGRVLSWDRPEELFAAPPRPSRQLHDLRYALLAAALMLWVADVAVRRLALPWGRIGASLAAALRRRPQPAGGAEAPDAGLGRLAARKQRAAAFYGGGERPAPPPEPAQPQARAGRRKPERSVRLRRPAPRRRARAARAGGKGPGRLRRGRTSGGGRSEAAAGRAVRGDGPPAGRAQA
ncbi:hypothetical protein VQ056_00045 [Paenibacillus sp. JTLBN-2024]